MGIFTTRQTVFSALHQKNFDDKRGGFKMVRKWLHPSISIDLSLPEYFAKVRSYWKALLPEGEKRLPSVKSDIIGFLPKRFPGESSSEKSSDPSFIAGKNKCKNSKCIPSRPPHSKCYKLSVYLICSALLSGSIFHGVKNWPTTLGLHSS